MLWVPFKISRSRCIIPRVILGCAYIGGLGGVRVGVVALDDLLWASSPSETTFSSATHVRLCSAVISVDISCTPGRCRGGRGAIGSSGSILPGPYIAM